MFARSPVSILLPAAAICLLATAAGSGMPERARELTALETAVESYLSAVRSGDLAHFNSSFHPAARSGTVRAGRYAELPRDSGLACLAGDAARRPQTRILALDLAGPCASAKAEWDCGSFKIVDYLSLLKIEGQWRIVGRIFYRTEEAGAAGGGGAHGN
jgi:hypothetical protein